MPKPEPGTFPPAYDNYICLVNETDLADAFAAQQTLIDEYFLNIPEAKTSFAYSPGKWTLKEMLQHIIDTERIFAYRALCISRKETQSLPGFEENEYALASDANHREWHLLCEELQSVRKSNLYLFNHFSEETLLRSGVSNKNNVTVLAIGFSMVGHIAHHKKIIEERYL